MFRYRINLSYKGTSYHGWQVQNNAVTVQGCLNNALTLLFREQIETIGCGRTDTGVHAHSYAAHFDCNQSIDNLAHTCYKLNCILPKDIAIDSICSVPDTFHARFDATERVYRYFMHSVKDPFLLDYSYFYPYNLNVDMMNEAAELLIGTKDFTSFSKLHSDTKTNTCTVRLAQWEQMGNNRLVFHIAADRFLRNMVRATVGTLIEVGRAKRKPADVQALLESKNRNEAGISVPAQGLFLWETKY